MAVRELSGSLDGAGLRVGIVVSRFNRSVTEGLLNGALEVPFAARRLAGAGVYDALVCLGAVVRGETPHFEYIAAEVTRGIGSVVADHRLPIAFGVLTTDTIEQALERSGAGHGNKGYESAVTAIEMAQLGRLLG